MWVQISPFTIIFWNDKLKKSLELNLLSKIEIKNNINNSIKIERIEKIEKKNKEINEDLLKNIKALKEDRIIKNLSSLNDWGLFKINNKNSDLFKNDNKNKTKIIKTDLNLFILRAVIEYLKTNKIDMQRYFLNKKYKNICELFNQIYKINFKKINKIKNKMYFNKQKIIYYLLDLKKLKTKVIVFKDTGCLFFYSNGLLFKKMMLNGKKYKKSDKISFLTIKNSINFLNVLNSCDKLIIEIKGFSNKSVDYSKFIYNNIKKKTNNKELVFIYNYKLSSSRYFKYKKIKAIKRRLKKKFLKLK